MSALIAVLVAAFLLHWFYLYDKGGAVGLGLSVPRQDAAVRKLHLSAEELRDLVEFLRALQQERPIDRAPDRVPSGLTPGGYAQREAGPGN